MPDGIYAGIYIPMPNGIWRVPLWNTFNMFYISFGVVRSLPWGPRGLAVRRLPQMQEVVGSNPTEGKICFSQFTLIYRVELKIKFKIVSILP